MPAQLCLQDSKCIKQVSPVEYRVDIGFVPGMRVPGFVYVNDRLKDLIFEELQNSYSRGGVGGFLPAVKQLANVAALPGIVEVRSGVLQASSTATTCLKGAQSRRWLMCRSRLRCQMCTQATALLLETWQPLTWEIRRLLCLREG